MAEKFVLDVNGRQASSTDKMSEQFEIFRTWASATEARLHHLQDNLLSLVGSFDGLVSLLISKEEVSEDAIGRKRFEFLEKIRLMREEAQKNKKAELWVPTDKKIVPAE